MFIPNLHYRNAMRMIELQPISLAQQEETEPQKIVESRNLVSKKLEKRIQKLRDQIISQMLTLRQEPPRLRLSHKNKSWALFYRSAQKVIAISNLKNCSPSVKEKLNQLKALVLHTLIFLLSARFQSKIFLDYLFATQQAGYIFYAKRKKIIDKSEININKIFEKIIKTSDPQEAWVKEALKKKETFSENSKSKQSKLDKCFVEILHSYKACESNMLSEILEEHS